PRSGTYSSRSSPGDAATGRSGPTPPRSTSSSPERCSPNHSRTQLTGTNSPAGKPESSSQASLPGTHHSPARDPPAPDANTNPCAQQTSVDDITSLTGRWIRSPNARGYEGARVPPSANHRRAMRVREERNRVHPALAVLLSLGAGLCGPINTDG